MQKKFFSHVSLINAIAVLAVLVSPIASINEARAANFGSAYVRLDRMQAGVTTTGLICAKPGSAASLSHDVQVTFPAGFTLGLAATFTTNTMPSHWVIRR